MKIAFTGLNVAAGKVKYLDPAVVALEQQYQPKKTTFYFFELLQDDYQAAEAIAIHYSRLLDLLILDIEKVETRLSRTTDPAEQAILKKAQAHLEAEKPLCEMATTEPERVLLLQLSPFSLKATIVVTEESPKTDELLPRLMDKAGFMFFYTAGKQEVRSWFVPKGSDAVTCAARIHSDLARGFVKAEIISLDDMKQAHSFQDARAKGLTKLVDRDFVIQQNTVLEIRFNV